MNKIIFANWKCNPGNAKEAENIFNSVCKKTKDIKNVEVVFCPPFIYFSEIKNSKLGAQDCFWEASGAFTGEVSAKQLSGLNCDYVLICHSERRRFFSETNEISNKKLKAVLENELIPVLCIGETQEQRDSGETQKIIESELSEGFAGISEVKLKTKGFVVAYEPVWAIGTGMPCDPEESQKMNLLIKKTISEIYTPNILKNLKVLYGGSVNSKNAASYVKEAGYDGLLVGGASLKPDEFSAIVKNCS